MQNGTTGGSPAIAIPTLLVLSETLEDRPASLLTEGPLLLNSLLPVEDLAAYVHDFILAMNGRVTERVAPRGFFFAPDGAVHPQLTLQEGGGQPDRRRTRRPQLKAVPEAGGRTR